MIADNLKVKAHPFNGYWIDVGTQNAYWDAHMDLLQTPPALDLNDRTWIIHTRSEERPPVKIGHKTNIIDSFLTDGTVVGEGAIVERSVLSPGVTVGEGAVVRDSIIFTNTNIGKGAVVERCLIDKLVTIGPNSKVGVPDGKLTSIGKNAQIPADFTIGENVIIGSDCIATRFDAYPNRVVPDGGRVYYTGP